MALSVVQSESAISGAGLTVTLGSGTTNGNWLLVLYSAVGGSPTPSLGGSWRDIIDQVIAAESGAHVYAAILPITSNENSVTFGSTGVNQAAALYEINASVSGVIDVYDTVINDLASTGTTAVLGSVDALTGMIAFAAAAFHDDDPTDMTWSNSFGNGPAYRESSSGTPDMAFESAYLAIASDNSYSTTASMSGAPGSDERHGIMVVIGEVPVAVFELAASANITASGENTTAQLTAPSGKSSGTNFGGGRLQDDENPGDAVDLDLDDYREDEWCIQAVSDAEDGEDYEFRVILSDGTPLDTYTVTPEVSIAAAAGGMGPISSYLHLVGGMR